MLRSWRTRGTAGILTAPDSRRLPRRMIEQPSIDEEEQVKESYAYFGLAVYFAQVIEHGLVNLVLLAKKLRGEVATRADVDAVDEREFSKTLGKILHDRKAILTFDPQLEADLRKALRIRNDLCHQYFRRNAAALCTVKGRAAAIEQLKQIRDFLMDVDVRLDGLQEKFLADFGLTREHIEAEHRRMVEEAS